MWSSVCHSESRCNRGEESCRENRESNDLAKQYFVYIMTNHARTLYVGVTSDLERRVYQHKEKLLHGFTERYNIDCLVYFEETEDAKSAIEREKQIKGWKREKKVSLVEKANPHWEDLSEGWYADG